MDKVVFGMMILCLCIVSGHAATVTRRVGDGDWATATEWSTDPYLPSSGDNAVLNNNKDVTVSTVVTNQPSGLVVNNQDTTRTTSSTLTVTNSGSLHVAGTIYVGENGAEGNVRMFSGGALSGNGLTIGHETGVHPSTLEFVLDESGLLNPIDISGTFNIRTNQHLVIDASAYTETNLVELVAYDSLIGAFETNHITITGFDGAFVFYDSDSMNIGLSAPYEPPPYQDELAAVEAIADQTNAPAIYADDTSMTTTTVNPGEIITVYYEGPVYEGAATRVYAYLGLPEGASAAYPVPAMVLVHGGGGTAYSEWVSLWNDRGYAAISIAVEGQTDIEASDAEKAAGLAVGDWLKHAMPGPSRSGIYGDSGVEPISDQWMYQAVSDAVLANSLLGSLPEVDADKLGLMGISWGGIITSTTMGIDERFKWVVPVYGCGNLADVDNHYGKALKNNNLYRQVWDPMVRMHKAEMPALWMSWPQDSIFPMDSFATCYTGMTGPHMVALRPGMGHGNHTTWVREESYDFADSVLAGQPWCLQQSVGTNGGMAFASFESTKVLDGAELVYTLEEGFTGDRTWLQTAAALADNGGGSYTISAELPEYATAWYLNGFSGTMIVSSDYQETGVVPPEGTTNTVSGLIEAESYAVGPGVQDEGSYIDFINHDDWVSYTNLNIAAGTYDVTFRYSSASEDCVINVETESGLVLGTADLETTAAWDTWSSATAAITFDRPLTNLVLRFLHPTEDASPYLCNLDWFLIAESELEPEPGELTVGITDLGTSVDAVNPLDLTAGGALDWVMLGGGGIVSNRNEKSDADYIGAVTAVGSLNAHAGNAYLCNWSDGAVITNATSVQGNWETKRASGNEGLLFSVEGLDPGNYTLTVYGAKYRATGHLTATLGTVTQTVTNDVNGTASESRYGLFLIDFEIQDSGDSLDVAYHLDEKPRVDSNVSITALTLVGVPASGTASYDLAPEFLSGSDEMTLSWATESNELYGIMMRTNLVDGTWINVVSNLPGTGGRISVTNELSDDAAFYRIYRQN